MCAVKADKEIVMNRKWMMVLLAFTLTVALWGGLPAQRVSAAITGVTINYYPRYIPINAPVPCTDPGGTPWAVQVTVTGDPGQNFTLQVAQEGGYFCMWSPLSSSWVFYAEPAQYYPRFTIGAGGTTNAWIYARAQSNSAGEVLKAYAHPCNADFTVCDNPIESPQVTGITNMNMSSSGGWLEESGGDRLGNTVVAVKNSLGNVVGLYRAENNSIEEGHNYDSGGYKIAVPHCTTCNYTIETWHASNPGVPLGNVNVMGTTCSVNDIPAGTVVNLDYPVCSQPTAIRLVSFSATASNGKTALLALFLLASMLVVILLLHQVRLRSRADKTADKTTGALVSLDK